MKTTSKILLTIVSTAIALFASGDKTPAAVPNQFIAKVYTEGLGRIPDQPGWEGAVGYFNAHGCNQSTLKAWGQSVYLSPEYASLSYDNSAKVLTVYLGVLNREPDEPGFYHFKNQLDSGAAQFRDVLDAHFNSAEFKNLVPQICTGNSYSFGTTPALELPTTSQGFAGGTGEQLQAILNNAASGTTIWLAQKSVTRLSVPLIIPNNVVLATLGNPPPNRYANMARLVRINNFNDGAVKLSQGSKLSSVWIDGARPAVGFNLAAVSLLSYGGDGTTLESSKLSNTAGWSSFAAMGSGEGWPCSNNVINNNLITVYPSTHYGSGWGDGLSVSCESTTVRDNQIIDATDVAIVLFRAYPAVQTSQVYNNLILNAGNSAYGAIVVDGLHTQHTTGTPSFHGSSVHSNTFWTSQGVHLDIGISVGTRAWFGKNSVTGYGIRVVGNGTGQSTIHANSGILISGMRDAIVQANALRVVPVQVSQCPRINVGASISMGFASGDLQPHTDVLIEGCIGH